MKLAWPKNNESFIRGVAQAQAAQNLADNEIIRSIDGRLDAVEEVLEFGYDDTFTTSDLSVTGLTDGDWLVVVQGYIQSASGEITILDSTNVIHGRLRLIADYNNGTGDGLLRGTCTGVVSGTSFTVDVSSTDAVRDLVYWQKIG